MFTILSGLLGSEQQRSELLMREALRENHENFERDSGSTHPGLLRACMGGGLSLCAHAFKVEIFCQELYKVLLSLISVLPRVLQIVTGLDK